MPPTPQLYGWCGCTTPHSKPYAGTSRRHTYYDAQAAVGQDKSQTYGSSRRLCGRCDAVQERIHCAKSVVFEKAFSGRLEAQFGDYILAKLLEQRSQDYDLNIKNGAKRRLKTSYEVYIAALMVESDSS